MKKIYFYIVKGSSDDPKKIFYKRNKNSLIFEKNDSFYFRSHYSNWSEEIKVECKYLTFDEETCKELITILEKAKKQAAKISEESIGEEISEKGSHSIIYSSFIKAQHQTPNSIFYFIAEMFIMLLMGHKLTNGNKRVSFMFLISVLRYFGYHFFWTQGNKQNYFKYISDILGFLKDFEKGWNNDKMLSVERWIIANTVIALQWR